MPVRSFSVDVKAPCDVAFDLVHDYNRRLQWDSMLTEARLLNGATEAGMGVRSVCTGTWRSAFLALETEYVQFVPGRVAAVKLTNHPPLFRRFAATIKHDDLGRGRSRITYIFSFQARPRILIPLLEPLMKILISREIRTRLQSLQMFLERNR